jgi:hypothetical protein
MRYKVRLKICVKIQTVGSDENMTSIFGTICDKEAPNSVLAGSPKI